MVSDKHTIRGRRRLTPYELRNARLCSLAEEQSLGPTRQRKAHDSHIKVGNIFDCLLTFPLIVYPAAGEDGSIRRSNERRRRDGERRETEWETSWRGVSSCRRNGVWAGRRCWDYGGRLSSFLAPEKLTDPRPVCSLFRKTLVYRVTRSRLKPFVTKQMEEITRLE